MSVKYLIDGEKVEKYAGAVLCDREENGYDDSDFYVLAWNGERIVKEYFATTRFGGGGSASVDATKEVQKLADAWTYREYRRRVFDSYVESLRTPEKGDTVTVARGRKVPVGTTGKLFWIGQKQTFGGYSRWSQNTAEKVGVAITERKVGGKYADVVWTYKNNLDVDISKKYSLSEAKRILRALKSAGWRAYLSFNSKYAVI